VTDPNNCKIVLSLHRFGKPDVVIAIGLGPEFRQTFRDDISVGPIQLVGFVDAVEILKTREMSLDMIRRAASQLGGQMADYLLDEGGWSGEDRKQATKDYPQRGDFPL